jgi:hypothetical protein
MTLGEWLDRREPSAPPELLAGIKGVLGDDLRLDATDGAAILLTAAERKLRTLVTGGETGRVIADDLLVIDALTTYAMEAATDALTSLSAAADDAMRRIGAISPEERPGS